MIDEITQPLQHECGIEVLWPCAKAIEDQLQKGLLHNPCEVEFTLLSRAMVRRHF